MHNNERCLSKRRVCGDFVPPGKNLCFFCGNQQNVKKGIAAFSAFLGNNKEREAVGFLADVV